MSSQRTLVFTTVASVLAVAIVASIYVFCYAGMPRRMPHAVASALANAKTLTLLSLYPDDIETNMPPNVRSLPRFHGYPILGKVELKGKERERALRMVTDGVQRNYGDAALCFNPRHGIIASTGLRSADFVICFECWQMQVHELMLPHAWVWTSKDPEIVLNDILTTHHVALAPQALKK